MGLYFKQQAKKMIHEYEGWVKLDTWVLTKASVW